jgi:hypothetical protein
MRTAAAMDRMITATAILAGLAWVAAMVSPVTALFVGGIGSATGTCPAPTSRDRPDGDARIERVGTLRPWRRLCRRRWDVAQWYGPDPTGSRRPSVRSPRLVCKSSNFAGSSVALTPLPESAMLPDAMGAARYRWCQYPSSEIARCGQRPA